MFFGESMFTRGTDASKMALAHLARQLERWGFGMIDCQMATSHLATFGARVVPRARFVAGLAELVECDPVGVKPGPWRFDDDLFD
jgi:leucyl/phenylalanyl-tRNA--protein transferase